MDTTRTHQTSTTDPASPHPSASAPGTPRTGGSRIQRLTAVAVTTAAVCLVTALPASAAAVLSDPVSKAQVEHQEGRQQATETLPNKAQVERDEQGAAAVVSQQARKAQLEYEERRAAMAESQRVNKAQLEHRELVAQRRDEQARPTPSSPPAPLLALDTLLVTAGLLTAGAAAGAGLVIVRRKTAGPRPA